MRVTKVSAQTIASFREISARVLVIGLCLLLTAACASVKNDMRENDSIPGRFYFTDTSGSVLSSGTNETAGQAAGQAAPGFIRVNTVPAPAIPLPNRYLLYGVFAAVSLLIGAGAGKLGGGDLRWALGTGLIMASAGIFLGHLVYRSLTVLLG
jgi:hypothetical protein